MRSRQAIRQLLLSDITAVLRRSRRSSLFGAFAPAWRFEPGFQLNNRCRHGFEDSLDELVNSERACP